MNVGIVVEGQDDFEVYPTLIRRIRNDLGKWQVRNCGGVPRLKNLFLGFLKEFHRNHAWRIDAALVIRDSDCKPPGQIEKQLQSILDASGFKPAFRVEFFAPQCMLESWLLGDWNAIRTVAVQRGHGAPNAPPNIQIPNLSHSADKDVFIQALRYFGLPATPTVYGEVATFADLTLIGNRCAYFRDFSQRIRAL